MKNIVIVNQSANYLMADIARAFKEDPHYDKVVILTGSPSTTGINPSDGISLDKITPYNKKTIFSRLKSWIVGTIAIIWKVKTRYKSYDLFLVSNPPTIHCFPFFCNNTYSTLVYDVYPDGIVTGGFVSKDSLIYKVWGLCARKFYKEAENIYVITEGMAKKIECYSQGKKVQVVPLWSNKDIIKVAKTDNNFIKEHNLEDKFVVMYSGNIGKGSNISVLIELAKKLKGNHSIMFVVIGEGMEKPLVVQAIKEFGLANMILLPYMPIDKLSYSLSAADLAYVSVEDRAANVCIPSKTFNLLNVETPFICIANKNASISNFIENYKIGRVFQPTDISYMVEFVEGLASDKLAYQMYVSNIQKMKNKYSFHNAEKFLIHND
jgi:glycosyltransferase involved in cell wall biosynthesis